MDDSGRSLRKQLEKRGTGVVKAALKSKQETLGADLEIALRKEKR